MWSSWRWVVGWRVSICLGISHLKCALGLRSVSCANFVDEDSEQGLRYKDYQLLRSEQVLEGRLNVGLGSVKRFKDVKELAADLAACGVLEWWRRGMGFAREEG